MKTTAQIAKINNEPPRSRDCGVSTADYTNYVAELRGINPKRLNQLLGKIRK
jgi:hypothetical protein